MILEFRTYHRLPDEARTVRTEVFMQEQGFVNEFDATDANAKHIVAFVDNVPIGTCRFFEDDGHDHGVGESKQETSKKESVEQKSNNQESSSLERVNQETAVQEGMKQAATIETLNDKDATIIFKKSDILAANQDGEMDEQHQEAQQQQEFQQNQDKQQESQENQEQQQEKQGQQNEQEQEQQTQQQVLGEMSPLQMPSWQDLPSEEWNAEWHESPEEDNGLEWRALPENRGDNTVETLQATDEMVPAGQGYIIGRVAVVKAYRGKNIGAHILRDAAREIKAIGGTHIRLAAQVQARGFYETLGYVAYGNEFDDEGCPHIWMKKSLQ